MSSRIGATEDAIRARLQQVLGNHVRTIEYAPPDWDEDYLKRVMLNLPGVFVIFHGGQGTPNSNTPVLEAHWSIVAAVRHVQTAKQRARGDTTEIGCFEIFEIALPALHGMTVFLNGEMTDENAVGTLNFLAWDNDASLQHERQAMMVQSLKFSMQIAFSGNPDAGLLVPFETFQSTYDIGQPEGAPVTGDSVELEQ